MTGDGLVPRGARAQARRPRRPAPAHGRRVQGRRPAPRLRVSALARLPRARRVGLAGSIPARSCRHEPSLLAPLALRRSRGRRASRVFGSTWAGLRRCSFASLALFCFGPGHGGSYATLALPGTAARQLLVPAALVLFFGWLETRSRARSPARRRSSARSRSSIRPTRCSCSCRSAGTRCCGLREWRRRCPASPPRSCRRGWPCCGCKPIADETLSRNPGAKQRLAEHRAVRVSSSSSRTTHHFRLAPEVLGRSGAVAVAALALLPLTALARRRRWAAFALGGTLRRAGADGGAVALRALLGCRLAVAVAPGCRVRAVAVRLRRRVCSLRARTLARPAGRARRRDRPAAPLARRLRLRPAARRPCGRRRGSRSSAARSRSPPCCCSGRAEPRARGSRSAPARAALFTLPVLSTASRTGARACRPIHWRSRRGSCTTCARRCRRARS